MAQFLDAMRRGIGDVELRSLVPSAYATNAHQSRSTRYNFVSTIDVVNQFREHGWHVVSALESRVRDETKSGFQRHMITMTNSKLPQVVGDVLLTATITNSHDGSSAYSLLAGLLRLICGNGMLCSDGTIDSIKVPHSHKWNEEMIEAEFKIIEELPLLLNRVNDMRAIPLNRHEQLAFSAAAREMRWESDVDDEGKVVSTAPVSIEQINEPKRQEDVGNDLWHTLNRVQENLIRGGIPGTGATGRKYTTKAVGGVVENVRLNKALWRLAEEMRQLKGGS